MSEAIYVNNSSFEEEVIRASVPVLVDFTASWCPPCRAIKPEVEALAKMVEGRAKVAFVDVDLEPELEARYGVKNIPALLIFKNGEVVGHIRGVRPRTALAEELETYMD